MLAPKCFLTALDCETLLTEELRSQPTELMDSGFYTAEVVRRLAGRAQKWTECVDTVQSTEMVRIVENSKSEGTFKER